MMKRTVGPFLVLLLFFACQSKKQTTQSESETEPAISMYIFDVGKIQVNDISALGAGADQKAPVVFTNSAYLIRHPKGDLLWDTGYPDSTINSPLGEPNSAYYSTMSKTLQSQLEEVGVSIADIDFLALSHLHPDHSGNLYQFTASTLILQEEEYDSLFTGTAYHEGLEAIRKNRVIKLQGDHDVFGDGTVVIKRAVGHTAGHQVLYVNLPETGPVVLSGDLWLFADSRQEREVPLFNVNADSTMASWHMINTFIQSKGATLWVQHDAAQMMALPHSPEVIR